MGRVNGVSQSLVALFRALGPPIAGNLFEWSIRDERPFPFNYFFNFVLQMLFFGIVFGVSFLLSPQLNVPKEEQQAIEMQPIRSSDDE